MRDDGYFMFTGWIFAGIALFHALRLVLGWEIAYLGVELPKIASAGIILLCLYLTGRAFRAVKELLP